MTLSFLTPRRGVTIGLLAIIPVLVFALGKPSLAGFVAVVNVFIIVGALYIAMRPVASDHHGSEESSHEST